MTVTPSVVDMEVHRAQKKHSDQFGRFIQYLEKARGEGAQFDKGAEKQAKVLPEHYFARNEHEE